MLKKLSAIDLWIVFAFIAMICFSALAAAFIAEAILKLEPCRLCIYQRYPFAIGFIVSIIGLLTVKKPGLSISLLLVNALNFLANSAIAFYHTGVEQHWWESKVEGCAMVFPEDTENQSILENIMSAPMGDCSKIPWQDPILGLSMANYNIPLCFGLALICVLMALAVKKHPKAVTP